MAGHDCRIDGLVITTLVRIDNEFILNASGGIGQWIDLNSGEWVFNVTVTQFEGTYGFGSSTSHADKIHAQMTLWFESKTPLTYYAFRDYSLFMDDNLNSVVLPRSGPV